MLFKMFFIITYKRKKSVGKQGEFDAIFGHFFHVRFILQIFCPFQGHLLKARPVYVT